MSRNRALSKSTALALLPSHACAEGFDAPERRMIAVGALAGGDARCRRDGGVNTRDEGSR